MEDATENTLTAEELEILQEVVNIAFGRASAELAECMDLFVVLGVPKAMVLSGPALSGCIDGELDGGAVAVIEQSFRGRFRGSALLCFDSEAGRALEGLYGARTGGSVSGIREAGSITQNANILAGAAVAKIAECLDDKVHFSSPRVSFRGEWERAAGRAGAVDDGVSVVIKTPFGFDKGNARGHLVLIGPRESVGWLKGALNRFMERYG